MNVLASAADNVGLIYFYICVKGVEHLALYPKRLTISTFVRDLTQQYIVVCTVRMFIEVPNTQLLGQPIPCIQNRWLGLDTRQCSVLFFKCQDV